MDIGSVITIDIESQPKVCILIDKKFGHQMHDRPHTNFFQRYIKPLPPWDFYVHPQRTLELHWHDLYSMTMFYELMYGDKRAYMRSDIFEKYVENPKRW